MECAHCGSDFDATPHTFALGIDQDGTWQVSSTRCPVCDRLIVTTGTKEGRQYPARPADKVRAKLSDDVPAELADEYWAASQVLPYSEEASAAISRRLLQRVLSAKAGAGYGGLADQIRRALASPTMPGYLKEALDTLVKLARLESHEAKSYRCDALAAVNEGEAKWLLEVLKPLFEFYYVQPALVARMRKPIEDRLAPAPVEVSGESDGAGGDVEGWTVVPEEPVVEPAPAKEPVR